MHGGTKITLNFKIWNIELMCRTSGLGWIAKYSYFHIFRSLVCEDEKQAVAVKSQLQQLARPMYSNPPVHGALIVSTVLGDPELKNLWLKEVKVKCYYPFPSPQEISRKYSFHYVSLHLSEEWILKPELCYNAYNFLWVWTWNIGKWVRIPDWDFRDELNKLGPVDQIGNWTQDMGPKFAHWPLLFYRTHFLYLPLSFSL